MYKILLVGSGQLGSRYLEGIAMSKLSLKVTVVDKSKSSLKKAKEMWCFKNNGDSKKEILWHLKLPSYNSKYDLAIISTTSSGRAKLISNISKKFIIKFWLLEKILAQSTDELDLIHFSTSKSNKVYVNTPRRIMKWFKKIKSEILNSKVLKIISTDDKWGLACNAIHYIDLVSWLTKKSLVSINTKKLNKKWFRSKRKGYQEVDGELSAKFQDNIELLMKSNPSLEKKLELNLSNQILWTIDEKKGIAKSTNGKRILGKIELQSMMTPSLIEQILIYGFCDLPELKESILQHKKLIVPLLKHWNKVNNRNDKLLPIT
jgi:hypothetical protein